MSLGGASRRSRCTRVWTAVLVSLSLAACAAPAAPAASGAQTAPEVGATEYPLAITDCSGWTTTFQDAPERVVTDDSFPAEMLMELGLGDRLVGTGYAPPPAQVPQEYADQFAELPALSDQTPSREVLIAARPDLVLSISGFGWADPGTATREELEALGVNTYQVSGDCARARYTDNLEPTFAFALQMGQIFDAPDAAERFVAEGQERLRAVADRIRGLPRLRVVYVDSYSTPESPTFAGGQGPTNAIIELAGGTNVFADVASPFAQVSWEELVARDPQVFLVGIGGDSSTSPADEEETLRRFLLSFPPIQEVSGIKDQRFVVTSYAAAGNPGPRNVTVVEDLAQGMFPQAS